MEAASKTDLQSIARIVKSNGTKGEMQAELFLPPEEIVKEEPVYIVFDGLPVPFFIENLITKSTKKALIRLTDVENLEDADELAGKYIYVHDDIGQDGEDPESIEGWTVYDVGGKKIGTITGFLDIPENPCLIVGHDGEEVYIPFHEDLIFGHDENEGKIIMDIPEGLI